MTAILPARSVPPSSPSAPGEPWPIETLWWGGLTADPPVRGGALPPALRARFAGHLEIPLHPDRPTIVANLVSTLDGVVALDRVGATGGREISGGFEPDRFLMGLLRATADAVLVGAGTFRASRGKAWTPGSAHPPSSAGYAEWRRMLGLPAAGPSTIILSGSGSLDLGSLEDAGAPVLIATTRRGAGRLQAAPRPDRTEIIAVADAPPIASEALLALLRDRGYGLVLSEAGPTLFGELLRAGAVDELFLTLAPQLAGRSAGTERLALVEGVGFSPDLAPWGRLRSVLRAADHLFLRHDLHPAERGAP